MKKVLVSLLLGVSMVTMAGCGNANKGVTEEEIDSLEVGETIEVNGIYKEVFGDGYITVIMYSSYYDAYEEDNVVIKDYSKDGNEFELKEGVFYNIKFKKTQDGYPYDDYEIVEAKEIECTDRTKSVFKDLNKIYNKMSDLPEEATPSYEDVYFDLEEELNNLDVSDCGMKELQPYFDRAKEKLEKAIEYNILCDYNDYGADSLSEAEDEIDFIKECLY